MSERARYRDFYDFYQIAQTYRLDIDETISLVKQKEVRQPISKTAMMRNWKLASENLRDEITLVYYQQDIYRNERGIEEFLNCLDFETIAPSKVE